MSDRVEEIRERWFVPPGSAFDFAIVNEDIDFLLSEVQRLRKVEEAAREVVDTFEADFPSLTARLRNALSHSLEQSP